MGSDKVELRFADLGHAIQNTPLSCNRDTTTAGYGNFAYGGSNRIMDDLIRFECSHVIMYGLSRKDTDLSGQSVTTLAAHSSTDRRNPLL